MHSDGRNHSVGFRINHADVVGFRVGDVDFVLPGIHCQPGWAASHRNRGQDRQSAQVNHRYAIAAAIGDVCVLVIIGAGLWSVLAACEQGKNEASR